MDPGRCSVCAEWVDVTVSVLGMVYLQQRLVLGYLCARELGPEQGSGHGCVGPGALQRGKVLTHTLAPAPSVSPGLAGTQALRQEAWGLQANIRDLKNTVLSPR